MKKGLWLAIGTIMAILIFGLFFLGGKAKNKTTPALPSPTPEVTGASPSATVHEIIIAGSEYSFTPFDIQVNKGEKVALVFRNVGTLPHNLVIPDLGLSTEILGKGESQTLEFTASETGTFPLYCSVGNHKSLGMEGKLEVK